MLLYVKRFIIAEKKRSRSTGQSLWVFRWIFYWRFAKFCVTFFTYGGYQIFFLERPIVKNSAEFFSRRFWNNLKILALRKLNWKSFQVRNFLFFVCLFIVTLIYQNFVVLRAFSCVTDSDIPYQIKALVVCVMFFIIIMCRKVTKKQAD